MEKYFIVLFHVLDHFRPFATLFFSLKKIITLAAGGPPRPPPFKENSAKFVFFFFFAEISTKGGAGLPTGR